VTWDGRRVLVTGHTGFKGAWLALWLQRLGARVSGLAAAGEVLVSQTVKDLVAGSGITFADRGVQQLKGVPGEWRLYSVAAV